MATNQMVVENPKGEEKYIMKDPAIRNGKDCRNQGNPPFYLEPEDQTLNTAIEANFDCMLSRLLANSDLLFNNG